MKYYPFYAFFFLPHSPMSDGECEKFPIKGTEKNKIITSVENLIKN